MRLGEKNIAMTNAASAMPAATANPICCRIEFPARTSDANVPDRIGPADPIAGPGEITGHDPDRTRLQPDEIGHHLHLQAEKFSPGLDHVVELAGELEADHAE